MEIREYVENLCKEADDASKEYAYTSTKQKDSALEKIAELLSAEKAEIFSANKQDVERAEANGISKAMIDRLTLDEKRIAGICSALRELETLHDPIGSGTCETRPNGLRISRTRVPIGVIAIIYEARPNVTVDAAAMCIKTGNCVILRGGKEAIETNRVLVKIMRRALAEVGINPAVVGLIENTDRESANILMEMKKYVDVLIPRGGAGLIRSVAEKSKIPVIETGAGNCHLYVDKSADIDMALSVAINAKTSRPSVCNAIETLLVHSDKAAEFLPKFAAEGEKFALEIRGCERTAKIISCKSAAEEDYATEYDDYIIAVKVVDSLDEAIAHINKYNTGHSEAIITNDYSAGEKFKREIDAAAVYVNASTRFTDGGEFGLGAEIGISTQKLHARGPMGLSALTTEKYLIDGEGQIR